MIGQPVNPTLKFNQEQLMHRNNIQLAINDKELNFINSNCICGATNGITLVNHDAWGFNIPTIVCEKCGIIRSKFFMDKDSLNLFYKKYYLPHMFTSSSSSTRVGMELAEYFWGEEVPKGKSIFGWISRKINICQIRTVLEVGCGCGGLLKSFKEFGMDCTGIDFNNECINYGKNQVRPAKLICGDFSVLDRDSYDLIILSDVVEHLDNPIEFFAKLKSFVHKKTYIYINVPGFYGISNRRFGNNIRQYTKIEHCWGHTNNSLNYLMAINGFECVSSNSEIKALYKIGTSTPFKLKKRVNSILFIKLFCYSKNFRNINYFFKKVFEKILKK